MGSHIERTNKMENCQTENYFKSEFEMTSQMTQQMTPKVTSSLSRPGRKARIADGELSPLELDRRNRRRARNREAAARQRERRTQILSNLENDIKSLSDENEKLKNENDSLQQEYDMIKIQLNMHMTGGFHQNSTMVGNFGVDHFANMTFASSSPPDYSQAVTECLTTSGDKESNNQDGSIISTILSTL